MKKLRTRFGSRLVPAKELLLDILRPPRRSARHSHGRDQEPTTSERRYWTRFLNRDTPSTWVRRRLRVSHASRCSSSPCVAGARLLRDGVPAARAAGGAMPPGALTEALRAPGRGADPSAPPDWLCRTKRWKLKSPVPEPLLNGAFRGN